MNLYTRQRTRRDATCSARPGHGQALLDLLMWALFFVALSQACRAADPQYTLRLSSWGSPTAPQVSVWVPAFQKLVEDGSKGRIVVQAFPAGALVKEQDVPSAVQSRVVDISLATVGGWASISPPAALLNSVLYRPTDADFQKMTGAGSPIFAALDASLQKHGVVLLSALDNGAEVVVSRAAMTTPAAFKGKAIRTYDKASSQIVQILGGSPSTMPVSDVYPALQRGTVEAAIGGIQGAFGLKEYEVAKYMLGSNGVFGVGVTLYVMNKAALSSLPADLQQVVLQAGREAEIKANTAIIASFADDIDAMRSHGMQVTMLQPGTPEYQAFIDAVEPLAKEQESRLPPDLVKMLNAGQ